jgi:hypothetical protein
MALMDRFWLRGIVDHKPELEERLLSPIAPKLPSGLGSNMAELAHEALRLLTASLGQTRPEAALSVSLSTSFVSSGQLWGTGEGLASVSGLNRPSLIHS